MGVRPTAGETRSEEETAGGTREREYDDDLPSILSPVRVMDATAQGQQAIGQPSRESACPRASNGRHQAARPT